MEYNIMRELNVKEIKEVNGGRWVKFFKFIAYNLPEYGGGDRYGSGGWRP
ncbi:hypothetical protein [Pseudoalteromonas sp.]